MIPSKNDITVKEYVQKHIPVNHEIRREPTFEIHVEDNATFQTNPQGMICAIKLLEAEITCKPLTQDKDPQQWQKIMTFRHDMVTRILKQFNSDEQTHRDELIEAFFKAISLLDIWLCKMHSPESILTTDEKNNLPEVIYMLSRKVIAFDPEDDGMTHGGTKEMIGKLAEYEKRFLTDISFDVKRPTAYDFVVWQKKYLRMSGNHFFSCLCMLALASFDFNIIDSRKH